MKAIHIRSSNIFTAEHWAGGRAVSKGRAVRSLNRPSREEDLKVHDHQPRRGEAVTVMLFTVIMSHVSKRFDVLLPSLLSMISFL